jgi:hypothetical protein
MAASLAPLSKSRLRETESGGFAQPVADPGLRQKVLRIGGIGFDLGANVCDVHAQVVGLVLDAMNRTASR